MGRDFGQFPTFLKDNDEFTSLLSSIIGSDCWLYWFCFFRFSRQIKHTQNLIENSFGSQVFYSHKFFEPPIPSDPTSALNDDQARSITDFYIKKSLS